MGKRIGPGSGTLHYFDGLFSPLVDSSDNVMVQYHALGLLYHIRKQDRLAITKLLAKLTKMSLKSPYAVILLIRIACKMIEEEDQDSGSPYFDFIESCLRHKVRGFSYTDHCCVSEPFF